MPSSLAEIAARCGVSKSTVSRALQNHPRISAARRAAIQAVAAEMGFRADPLQAFMRDRRWARRSGEPRITVALVFESQTGFTSMIPFFEARAAAKGMAVDLIDSGEIVSGRRLSRVLRSRGVSAVIFGQISEARLFEGFAWEHFVAVECLQGFVAPPVHIVGIDYCGLYIRAFLLLRERGYRRVGVSLFRHEHDALDDQGRLAGALYGRMKILPESSDIPIIQPIGRDPPDWFVDWVRSHRLEAVITVHNREVAYLREAGVGVPEDIGILSMNAGWDGGLGAVSGFEMQSKERAYAALDLLEMEMRNFHFGLPAQPRVLTIDPPWYEGETLRRG